MHADPDAPALSPDLPLALAFQRGRIDALAQSHLAPEGLFTPDMRAALALRMLGRAWAHYREDRAITLGARLVGSECAAERDAFLALVMQALPPRETHLTGALRTVRRIMIAPLAPEARQTAARVADSKAELAAVLETATHAPLPEAPLERAAALIARHRYSQGEDRDLLRATAATPCWALNLLGLTRVEAFGLCPLPCPGVVGRGLFRADLEDEARHALLARTLIAALDRLGQDILQIARAAHRFDGAFPALRRNSRLGQAWLLLVALGAMTPAQLARALPATKAGAAKLLRQLETARFAHNSGPYAPFVATMH